MAEQKTFTTMIPFRGNTAHKYRVIIFEKAKPIYFKMNTATKIDTKDQFHLVMDKLLYLPTKNVSIYQGKWSLWNRLSYMTKSLLFVITLSYVRPNQPIVVEYC